MRKTDGPCRRMPLHPVDFIAQQSHEVITSIKSGSVEYPVRRGLNNDICVHRVTAVHDADEGVFGPIDWWIAE
jgi:hypothetical protein